MRKCCINDKGYNTVFVLPFAFEKDKSILKDKSKLPTKYKGKKAVEIEADIKNEKARRDNIKQQIQDLSKKRKQHIKENRVETETINYSLMR